MILIVKFPSFICFIYQVLCPPTLNMLQQLGVTFVLLTSLLSLQMDNNSQSPKKGSSCCNDGKGNGKKLMATDNQKKLPLDSGKTKNHKFTGLI